MSKTIQEENKLEKKITISRDSLEKIIEEQKQKGFLDSRRFEDIYSMLKQLEPYDLTAKSLYLEAEQLVKTYQLEQRELIPYYKEYTRIFPQE